jgi:hypothetical protein
MPATFKRNHEIKETKRNYFSTKPVRPVYLLAAMSGLIKCLEVL